MGNVRLIARLDVKGPYLIKGVHLEGLRKVGDPNEFSVRYYEDGADEIIYMDAVASLYGRNSLADIVCHTAENVFIPITVGGGLRSISDIREILRRGADKIAVNTAAVANPSLISEAADRFGSQCIVLSIEAKRTTAGTWEAYTDNGREKTGINAVEWAAKGAEAGAGEILVTSIDMEGTGKGFDVPLVNAVAKEVSVPVIASGGMGSMKDVVGVVNIGHADAVAIAGSLHWKKFTMRGVHDYAREHGLPVRRIWNPK